jgi:dTDP-4-dehydrorhamnose reductase
MIRLMNERDKLRVVSDQVGSPTWATGLAKTIWALVDKGASGAFHHSDHGEISWYDFAVVIAEEAHALGLVGAIPAIEPIATQEYPTPARRPAYSVLDCSATRELLGAEPVQWRHNLRCMLEKERDLG